MAKNAILNPIIRIFSFPFITLSRTAEFFNMWNLREDIERCLTVIDTQRKFIPRKFIDALITAEDHRNALHFGVDPISMIRAAFVRFRRRQIEGASTIEQQFVRTALMRYEHKLNRKIKEQALAVAISRRRNKVEIASAYLSIAFYGSGHIGFNGLVRCCGELETAELDDIVYAISRLKYPQPLIPTQRWRNKIARRARYVNRRMGDKSKESFAILSTSHSIKEPGLTHG